MKKRKDLFLIHERKHSHAVKIINLLLIALLGFLMVSCDPGEKFKIDLVKMDRKDLEKELENVTEKSKEKVNILNELAYREERNGPKEPPEKDALDYVQEAWNLAEDLGYNEGLIESLCMFGRIYYFRGEYDKSFEYCEDGLTRALEIGWLRGQAMAYNGIARYHQVMGEYEDALENFIESKEISEQINEWRELANANYGFGALFYYDQKNYSEALGYFEKCLKLGKLIGDNTIISSGYYAIGEMYRSLEKFDIAKKYFDKCMKVSKGNNIRYNMANAYEGYGEMEVDKGKLDEALKHYKNSLEIFKAIGDQYQVIGIKLRLGRLFIKKKDYEEALKYLKEVYNLATTKQIPLRIKDSSAEIIKVFEKSGDYKPAVDYFESYQKNNEFLSNNVILNLKAKYEYKKKSDEEEISRKYWIAGFLIILAATLLLLWNSAKLLRQKRALEKSYKDIERMSEIGQVITSSLSQKEIYNRVFQHVKRIMDADCFWIYWYEEKLNRLDLVGGKEEDEKDIDHYYELTETNRPAVKCFLEQKTLIFKDYPNEYPLVFGEPHPKPKKGKSFKAHIFLPLIIEGDQDKKIGVITVQSSKKNAYKEKHVTIFKNIGGYAAIALDNAHAYKHIEEQKTRIEQQALELEKTVQIEKEISQHKDELMYTVSHQYKTPITIIQGSAQIFRDYFHKMKEKDIQEHLNKIFNSLDYMSDLIESLLNFGKKFNPGYYDLRDFCEKFVDSIKSNEGSGHHIEFKAEGDCARVKMDKEFMNIILSNLVMNSINYSDRGSKILVDLRCETDHAVIKVIDNGIGIPGDYLKMPFERFHRGSNVGSIRGTGLGLALVKRYLDLHNGLIEIESQLEKGTTITINLPKN